MRSVQRAIAVLTLVIGLSACGQEDFKNVRKDPLTSVTQPTIATPSYSVITPSPAPTTETTTVVITPETETTTVAPPQTIVEATPTVPAPAPATVSASGASMVCTGTVLPRGVTTIDHLSGAGIVVGNSQASLLSFSEVPPSGAFSDICLQTVDDSPPRGFLTGISAAYMNNRGLTQVQIGPAPDGSDPVGVVLIQ